jgi:hypothetical protein
MSSVKDHISLLSNLLRLHEVLRHVKYFLTVLVSFSPFCYFAENTFHLQYLNYYRAAFPDLDYRAHDFRIVESDPCTVRLTARAVGTMRGELRLRTETLPPNGKRMICPPGKKRLI